MPMQQGNSALAAKLGAKLTSAVSKHGADETTMGTGGDLPDGIEGGIARLTDCRFGVYKDGDNKGEYFFIAAGTVVEPVDFNGLRLKGLRTQVGPEPICDTPKSSGKRKTLDDHVAWVLNEFRKLGAATKGLGGGDLEAVAEALKKAKPFFRFRTWKGKKQTTGQYANQEPRTQHEWRGVCEYQSAGESVSEVVADETAEAPDDAQSVPDDVVEDLDTLIAAAVANDDEGNSQERLTARGIAAGVSQSAIDNAADWEAVGALVRKAEGGSSSANEGGTASDIDYSELAKQATDGDSDATATLTQAAKDAGIDTDGDWFSQASWDEVVEKMQELAKKGSSKPVKPKKDDVVFYKPIDPKTKKPVKKAAECIVVSVDPKANTANLRNLDDNKVYKSVKFTDMESK